MNTQYDCSLLQRGAMVLFVALAIIVPCSAVAAPGDRVYAQPGRLVGANGARLNLYCVGSGSPTVVFESGWEDWAPAWAVVQPRVAQWARACSYDRAGAGFSDAGRMPRSAAQIVDELRAALQRDGIKGPYILVGHAFGGVLVRTFAQRHLDDVAGLVLVEADVPGADEHRGDVGPIRSLRECREAIVSGTPLPLLPASPGSGSRNCTQQFFRGLPEQQWSADLNTKLLEIARTKPAMYDGYISEMEQMPANEEYLAQHARSLGSRPIRVLSTGYHGIHSLDPAHPKTAEQQQYEERVARAQAKWLALSSNAKQVFVADSSEYIQFDQPAAVVDAIHEVFEQAK
jgi:pimeloyl-ACP methyl ester carboxylesterase